jgi:8-oxo-dGTP pyrophosphatase MutT (NUDIX family)
MPEAHENRLARWAKSGREGTPPVPAATVIMIRDGTAGLETLMLRKNSKIAFGGMWVFPGGRVDAGDRDPARPEDALAAARRAAAREAEEETGLVVSGDAMLPFSHWTPPPITPRRFTTWFFLAPAPAADVVIDGGEIREHAWMRPPDALWRREAGEIEIAPPTWVTLHTLSRWETVGQAMAAVRELEPEHFETRVAVEAGGPTALWHGDAGWETGDADAAGPRHRLRMHADGWSYERDPDEPRRTSRADGSGGEDGARSR